MAGILSRLGNLWRGFLRLWISDVEKEHPEIAYENAIDSMIEKYSRLKSATAAIIRRREETDERFKRAAAELTQTEAELDTAVDTGQDDLALILIQKKNALTAEVGELKAEKDSMLAKMQSAQARIKVQEQLDGLSVDAEVKALDNVRQHIKTTIAEANLGKELSESSLDNRLAALKSQVGDVQAKNQLAELKAKKAAPQAAPQSN